MFRRRRKYLTPLDWVTLILAAGGAVLFLASAVFYVISVIVLSVHDGPPPLFTLGEIATYLGIAGMGVIPLYIITEVIAAWRERKKTGKNLDDKPERGTAERS